MYIPFHVAAIYVAAQSTLLPLFKVAGKLVAHFWSSLPCMASSGWAQH